MYDDPCPNCGHQRKRTLMSTDPDAPSPLAMWQGEGEFWQVALARIGFLVIPALLLVGLMQIIGITL